MFKTKSELFKNIVGGIIGLIIINIEVATIVLLSNDMKTYIAIIAYPLISIGLFFAVRFLPIKMLKKSFWLGMLIGLGGGIYLLVNYNDYWQKKIFYEMVTIPKELSINEIQRDSLPEMLAFNDARTLTEYMTFYEKKYRAGSETFIVAPVVTKNWKPEDSITIWAGYIISEMNPDKTLNNFYLHLNSPNKVAWMFENYERGEDFTKAVQKAENLHKIKSISNFYVAEWIDRDVDLEILYWHFISNLLLVNALWTAVALFFIVKLK